MARPCIAELLGYGLSADGYHPTAPHPEGRGAARAIQTALAQSGVSSERGQLRQQSRHRHGEERSRPRPLPRRSVSARRRRTGRLSSSTKSMIGHLLGGAGAAEAIVTVKAIEEQVAPPTANFTEPDPECDLDYTPNRAGR